MTRRDAFTLRGNSMSGDWRIFRGFSESRVGNERAFDSTLICVILFSCFPFFIKCTSHWRMLRALTVPRQVRFPLEKSAPPSRRWYERNRGRGYSSSWKKINVTLHLCHESTTGVHWHRRWRMRSLPGGACSSLPRLLYRLFVPHQLYEYGRSWAFSHENCSNNMHMHIIANIIVESNTKTFSSA